MRGGWSGGIAARDTPALSEERGRNIRRTERTLVKVTSIYKSATLTVDMLVHTVPTSLH